MFLNEFIVISRRYKSNKIVLSRISPSLQEILNNSPILNMSNSIFNYNNLSFASENLSELMRL